MKKENRTIYKIIAVLALMLAFWSCKEEMNKTGYDLLLPGDLVSAHKMTMEKLNIRAYTVRDENLSTNKPEYNLLGSMADPVFGLTVADFAAQFKLLEVPQFKAGEQIDSMVLLIGYRSFYGDTIAPLKLNVYELTSDLKDDTVSYQNEDLKSLTNGQVVGSTLHYPTRKKILKKMVIKNSDTTYTVDTIYTDVRVKLNDALKNKLAALSLSSLEINKDEPNIPFLKEFKGLYVESEPLTEGGAILRSYPYAIAAYTHKWEKLKFPKDTTKDTLMIIVSRIDVTKNSARVSRFDHGEYLTSTFATKIGENVEPDTLIYLQTTGGLSSKIYIDDLDKWTHPDSAGITINKAQLIFTVEPMYTDKPLKKDTIKPDPDEIPIYLAPPKLILGLIGNDKEISVQKGANKGQLIFPVDLTFSESYYGGIYDAEAGTYTFNLAAHLQKLMKKEVDAKENLLLKNNGFYLTTDQKNAIYNRVVLKGAKSKVGIRFEVTYTKMN